jgi:phage pi2 protein 07
MKLKIDNRIWSFQIRIALKERTLEIMDRYIVYYKEEQVAKWRFKKFISKTS